MARSSISTPSWTQLHPPPRGSSSGECFAAVAVHEQFVLAPCKCDTPAFCSGGRRNVASRARWVEEAGAAEVVESKGKLWMTTGVTRGGKLCYNIEETGYATCSMKCRSCSIIRFLVVFICTGPLIMVVMVCFASSTGSLSFAA